MNLIPTPRLPKISAFDAASVPDSAVNIERLEYVAQAADASPLLESVFQPSEPREEPRIAAPFTPSPDDDIPPFLREASLAALDAPDEDADVTGTPEGEPLPEASQGDLPAWVKALAPTGDEDTSGDSAPYATEIPDWLRSGPPQTAETSQGGAAETPEPETPSWLKDLGAEVEEPVTESVSPEVVSMAGMEGSPLTTDAESLSELPEDEGDNLAWLESLAGDHDASLGETTASVEPTGETPTKESGTPSGDTPGAVETAWLTELSGKSRSEVPPAREDKASPNNLPSNSDASTLPADESLDQAPAVAGETPETGASLERSEERSPSRSEFAEPPSEVPTPDWLQSLAQEGDYAKLNEETAEAGETESTADLAAGWPRVVAPPSVGVQPPWLSGQPSEPSAANSLEAPLAPSQSDPDAVLPEWLSGLEKNKSSPPDLPASQVPPPWLQTQDEALPDEPAPIAEDVVSAWQPAEPAPAPNPLPEPQIAAAPIEKPEAPTTVAPDMPDTAASGPIPKAQKQGLPLLDNAKAELGRGNIAAALDAYGKLIHKGKSLTDIIRDLRDALSRYPVEVPIWQALGDAYMRANRLQEALDAYTKAEELLR